MTDPKEKDKWKDKGKQPSGIFNRGYLAKVKAQKRRSERELLAKTSLRDLIK
jgi:hypothetical protein